MSVTMKLETITPEIAEKYLALSAGNRTVSEAGVLSLAVEMESGRWQPHAGEIVFDETGNLIDGHHRLQAVVLMGKSIEIAVKRGLPRAARAVIDTGKARTLADLFNMYRGGTNVLVQIAALRSAAGLLMGPTARVKISTLGAADAWMRQFKDGIEWVVPVALGAPNGVLNRFKVGPVTGAFAFAHKMNPPRVEKFLSRCIDGIGLEAGEPALVLRNYVMGNIGKGTGRGGDRYATSLKVLNAIYADLRGKPILKLQVSDVGLSHFRTAYDTKAAMALVKPWVRDSETAKLSIVAA